MNDAPRLNAPTFDQLRLVTVEQAEALSPEEIILLQDDLTRRKHALQADQELMAMIHTLKYQGVAESAYRGAQKDTGTCRVSIDAIHELKIDRDKKVDWDQEKLDELWRRIEAAGDDPTVWIKRKIVFSVGETAYQAWPPNVQGAFAPARVVVSGKTKYEVKPKKEQK